MSYEGIPSGKISFDRIPSSFFSDLLPSIDNLGEIKVTLYFLWKLDRMEGEYRYLTISDFLIDERFISGLPGPLEDVEKTLEDLLSLCVERGSILKVKVHLRDGEKTLYFFNSPKGRQAVKSIRDGEWRPSDNGNLIPIVLEPERPNIFSLYEENVGPITPLLAEVLTDAETEFSGKWIEEAFRIAVENNVRNWRYINAILRRWKERGYDVRKSRRDSEKTRQEYADWED